jgi:hypothetical protein
LIMSGGENAAGAALAFNEYDTDFKGNS